MQSVHVFFILSAIVFALSFQGIESGAVKAVGNEACNCVGDVLKIGPAKPPCPCQPDVFEQALCCLGANGEKREDLGRAKQSA